jgi:hypothetical protein
MSLDISIVPDEDATGSGGYPGSRPPRDGEEEEQYG